MFEKFVRKCQKPAKVPLHPVSPACSDVLTLRIVVITLSMTTIGCAGSSVWLNLQGKQSPDLLTTLATSSVAAMVVVLKPSPRG